MSFVEYPGNIGAVAVETVLRVGGLVAFFCGILWLGTKLAGRAYSLEPASFSTSQVKPDGVFYKAVKAFGGGGSFGTLLSSVFKEYARRLENLSNIIYITGLLLLTVIAISSIAAVFCINKGRQQNETAQSNNNVLIHITSNHNLHFARATS